MAKLSTDRASRELRAFGLAYPGAHLKSPWPGSLSCKLKISSATVVNQWFAKPTAYGLGRAGWVTMEFAADVPVEMLENLIVDSYCAIAGIKLRQQLDARLAPDRRSKKGTKAIAPASRPAATLERARARAAAEPKARMT